jgi:formylglycine-generating enzyme required for sulfatase activity
MAAPIPKTGGGSPRAEVPATARVPAGRVGTAAVGPFRLGRTPVTNIQYAPFVETGRAAAPPWRNDPDFSAPAKPVVGVTWQEAVAYASWLGEIAGGVWRLPTETEWEHAACGGLRAPKTAWGDRVPAAEIPEGPLEGPWEAGRGAPNGYGLYDMGTIVHEWCANAHGPDPRRRASRGGSWRHRVRWSSPSAPSSLVPDFRYSDYGFRVLQEIG